MDIWSPEETVKFLRDEGVSERNLEKIVLADLDGKMLHEFTIENFTTLGLPLAAAIQLENIRNNFCDAHNGIQQSNSSLAHKTKRTEQIIRPFLHPVGNVSYEKGNYVRHEIGPSSLCEPSREFKQFFVKGKIEDYEVPFVKKLGKFLIACLNRRCNGTIYFGVGVGRNIF